MVVCLLHKHACVSAPMKSMVNLREHIQVVHFGASGSLHWWSSSLSTSCSGSRYRCKTAASLDAQHLTRFPNDWGATFINIQRRSNTFISGQCMAGARLPRYKISFSLN